MKEPAAINKRNSRLLLLILAGISPYVVNGYINTLIHDDVLLYWCFELFSWITLPVAVFYVAWKYLKVTPEAVGLHGRIFGRSSVLLVIGTCIVFCPIDYWLYRSLHGYFSALFPPDPYFQYQSIVPATRLAKLLVVLYFAVTAGVVEEIYYRGGLWVAAQGSRHPEFTYIAISPVLFSIVHWEGGLANLLATFALGIFLAAVYLATKNLWPLIAGHVYTDYVWYS